MTTQMDHLNELVKQLFAATDAILAAEAQLKEAQGLYDRIDTILLPEAMDAIEMKKFVLRDGSEITIKEDIFCGITAERRAEAFAWLRANGSGSLIKRELTARFGKGEEQLANAIHKLLAKEAKREIADKETVHHSTLKAFCQEMLDGGSAFPMDLFGVVPQRRAVVKPPAA